MLQVLKSNNNSFIGEQLQDSKYRYQTVKIQFNSNYLFASCQIGKQFYLYGTLTGTTTIFQSSLGSNVN